MATMKAAVIREAGGPDVLKIESLPIPTPKSGEVLIRVKAFGINRSEMFTRQGHSPGVKFPRVLGIEAVGVVEEAPGSEFRKGDIVATGLRDGACLRWRICRIHVRPCRPGAGNSNDTPMGDPGSDTGDVADCMG